MTIATPHATGTPPQAGVPFQQVLLLCVPALIIGLVFRVSFLIAIPEVYYGADSNSYFEAASKLWTQGDFSSQRQAALSLPHHPHLHAAPSRQHGCRHRGRSAPARARHHCRHRLGRCTDDASPQSVGAVGHLRGGNLAAHALVRARDDRGSLAAGSLRCRGCDRRAVRLAQGSETAVLVSDRGHRHRGMQATWQAALARTDGGGGGDGRQSPEVGEEEPGGSGLRRADHSHCGERTAGKLAFLEFNASLCADARRALCRVSRHLAPACRESARQPAKLCDAAVSLQKGAERIATRSRR